MAAKSDNIKIVVIDDDFAIRFVVNSYLAHSKKYHNVHVFTSENGVEGVGYVLITNPHVVIVDSTLPGYSGLELLDYLRSNREIKTGKTPILVIHETNQLPNLGENFITLSKNDSKFFPKLLRFIDDSLLYTNKKLGLKIPAIDFYYKETALDKLKRILAEIVIRIANLSDEVLHHREKVMFIRKISHTIFWLLIQLVLSVVMSLYTIVNGSSKEENVDQAKSDSVGLRVRVYPTILIFFVSIIVVLIQAFILVGGGIILVGTRVSEIFKFR